MKTLYFSLKSILSGETVLLGIGVLLFLAAMADATHWHVLRSCRFCIILTMLFSVTFLLLSAAEIIKGQRSKRAILAAALFLAATIACFSQGHLVMVTSSE